MQTQVQAKLVCNAAIEISGGDTVVHMNAVYSDKADDPNKSFTDSTPNAYLQMQIKKGFPAADYFKNGKKYLVTFEEQTE